MNVQRGRRTCCLSRIAVTAVWQRVGILLLLCIASSAFAQSHPVNALKQSVVVLRDNAPVKVAFDRRTQTYIFTLPYLYVDRKVGHDVVYTLLPPLLSSKFAKDVAQQVRCKALSDPQLTYRFLLCRTTLIDTRRSLPSGVAALSSLGSAGYYILSDGREAGSTVKLTFEDTFDPPQAARQIQWEAPSDATSLASVARQQLRLRFNASLWNTRADVPQRLSNGVASPLSSLSVGSMSDSCTWFPKGRSLGTIEAPSSTVVFHNAGSWISAEFNLNSEGNPAGTVLCYFEGAATPGDITISRLRGIVGELITLEVARD
jgi:hypothetical protein